MSFKNIKANGVADAEYFAFLRSAGPYVPPGTTEVKKAQVPVDPVVEYNELRKYEMDQYRYYKTNHGGMQEIQELWKKKVAALQKTLSDREVVYPAQESQKVKSIPSKPANELEKDPAVLEHLESRKKIDSKGDYLYRCIFKRRTLGEWREKKEAMINNCHQLDCDTKELKQYHAILQKLVDQLPVNAMETVTTTTTTTTSSVVPTTETEAETESTTTTTTTIEPETVLESTVATATNSSSSSNRVAQLIALILVVMFAYYYNA